MKGNVFYVESYEWLRRVCLRKFYCEEEIDDEVIVEDVK